MAIVFLVKLILTKVLFKLIIFIEDSKVKVTYPGIFLSPSIASPAALSKMRKNVLYVGTGAGIATFLWFADREYQRCLRNQTTIGDKKDMSPLPEEWRANFVFISRELEHMRWMAKYIEGILTFPDMTRWMKFHIYLTIKGKANSLPSFLFWRALFLFNRKKEGSKDVGESLIINLGRPNFEKIINDVCVANDIKNHHVYACGPVAMTSSIEKICLAKSDKETRIIFNYETF
jgi:hypothetical protein